MAEADALSPMAALARRADPDRFLCALFVPSAARETIFTLIGFNHELARAREVAREPMMALIRLQWWRDTIEEAMAGKPPRRHEVAGPVAVALQEGRLDPGALLRMAEAREAEEPPEDRAALERQLRGTAGELAAETGRVLGAPASCFDSLCRAGMAYGLAGTLRSLPVLAAQGRQPLPPGCLPTEAKPGPDMARELHALAAWGLGIAREARSALRDLPRRSIAAALPVILADRDLKRLSSPDWNWAAAPAPRGGGDRLALSWAGLRGRV
ncbi:squalene/phytoene synthase family protein [Roseomonas sp. SSH11]|uniref:Squalene/phytoene synthase family protein n=1 Tax=Pararoseomonas baculiformis TaxID=2820812 RepID=A0ABS4AAB9_9PROT|nr:squalene/phytoene synthase family protein [Pararoseomonas baculiformis]MBP0443928.1 squalene/phytoene synthase family protein [Pararoseomonas baculiformis]